MAYPSTAKYIWDYFMHQDRINNAYGVAGLMGNLQAESGLIPNRLQGDFTTGYTKSAEYTAKVDDGRVSEYDFVNNGPGGGGYGLAQWTYYTRKQNLYNRRKQLGYASIGDIGLACDYLWEELQTSYKTVLKACKEATNIRTPSDAVLHDFERPADQSVAVEEARAALGQGVYTEYNGSAPSTDVPDAPESESTTKSSIYLGSKLSIPYIFITSAWKATTPHIYHNNAWVCGTTTDDTGPDDGDTTPVTPPSSTEVWTRTSKPEKNNKYYNITKSRAQSEGVTNILSYYGISGCIAGKSPTTKGPIDGWSALYNCVGGAWGAFNETWALNAPDNGPPGGWHSQAVNAHQTLDYCDADPILAQYVVRLANLKNPNSYIPPLGGLIVWSKQHIGYVSETNYNNKDLGTDIIYVEQSAWGGIKYPGTDPETQPWANSEYGLWAHSKLRRNTSGMANNSWWFNASASSGGYCIGFVKNPALLYDDAGNCLGRR